MWIFYILLTCVILNPHRWGRCLTRTGPKYVGSSFWTESLRINVGYTNSFSVCFFVNTYDTVHNVLIKIHIVFTIAYNTRMELAENFFSQKSVIARKRSVTPFFWAKCPLSPPPKKTASAAKPILACFYKTLTMGARRSCGKYKKRTRGSHVSILKRLYLSDISCGTWEAVQKCDKLAKELETRWY